MRGGRQKGQQNREFQTLGTFADDVQIDKRQPIEKVLQDIRELGLTGLEKTYKN